MSCNVSYSLRRRISDFFSLLEQRWHFDDSQRVYNGRSYQFFWSKCPEVAQRPYFSRLKIYEKARFAFLEGGFRPDECVLYGFENSKRRERDQYISQRMKDQLMISLYGSDWRERLNVLKDKYVFYSYMKDLFNRDVTYIKGQEDRLPFLAICQRNKQIFVKLNRGNCGNGARTYAVSDDEQAGRIFDELVGLGEWIVEEVIKQAPEISVFNPSSINTVRFPSFKRDGVVKCVYPCMRFGRAGSIVDNAGQGGVFVSIDRDTGEIISDAYDEKGNVFFVHPDSKVAFRGFRVPRWTDLIELVKKAHLALPDNQVYVAFDFALSEKGWCLVEGNWGDWILQQTSLNKGFKNEFVSFLNGNR